jgi:hypothetical protein
MSKDSGIIHPHQHNEDYVDDQQDMIRFSTNCRWMHCLTARDRERESPVGSFFESEYRYVD